MTEKKETTRLILKNVRLSFPSIFKKSNFNGTEGKYEATFLIPKTDKKTIKLINERIEEKLNESKLKSKIPLDKMCLKDGDGVEYAGYADHYSLKASSNNRPTVLNSDKTPLVQEDGVIYAGCYVNASIDIWIQNNQYGKRVNANLYGIQFYKDGEPFSSDGVDVTDDFEELDDEDDFEEETQEDDI